MSKRSVISLCKRGTVRKRGLKRGVNFALPEKRSPYMEGVYKQRAKRSKSEKIKLSLRKSLKINTFHVIIAWVIFCAILSTI